MKKPRVVYDIQMPSSALDIIRTPAIKILDARIDPVVLELRARAFNYEARLTLRKKPKNL